MAAASPMRIHLSSLNDEGRITRMGHYVDTAKQIKAYGLA
jgi:hypothetical protein